MVEEASVYAIYVASMVLAIIPLTHILARKRFQKYFVYFVTCSGFLLLNLVGSISPNILDNYPSIEFHLILLANSAFLFLLYLSLPLLAGAASRRAVGANLIQSDKLSGRLYRHYIFALAALCVCIVVIFSVVVAPPILFRFDLFGNWAALIEQRTELVLGSHKFHWFAIAFFDIPLFLVVLTSVMRFSYWMNAGHTRLNNWRAEFWMVIPVSMLLSVSFLHKTYLIYIIAALALVSFIMRNSLPVKSLLKYSVVTMVPLFLLYFTYTGFAFESSRFGYIGEMIFHRMFEVYPWGGAIAVDLFPEKIPFLYGRSVTNISGVFNYEQVNLADLIYPYIYGELGGTGGSPLPAIFESYANFGWLGVLLSFVIIGLLVLTVTKISWSQRPVNFALGVFLSIKMILIWEAPFWFGILEPTTIFLVPFLYLTYLTMRYIPVRKKYVHSYIH